MAKTKRTGFSAEFQQLIMELTKDSPLLLVGTVLNRNRLTGKSSKGDWEMFRVEVRGIDGRSQVAVVNEPAAIPPKGEFVCLPVFVGQNGGLREARQMAGTEF